LVNHPCAGRAIHRCDERDGGARRVAELTVTYLPNVLLDSYCGDKAEGREHAYGVAFNSGLSNFYTVAQLEAEGLWNRMDAKIAKWGGCAFVPPTFS
jgi:hypothetical protein